MPTVRRRVERRDPPLLSAATKARLDRMTLDEIERNAVDDVENPPMTDDELDRAVFARAVRRARKTTGLNQASFASLYHIGLGRLRDWEQGRVRPDSVALAYLTLIENAPDVVARTIETKMSETKTSATITSKTEPRGAAWKAG